MDQKFILSCLVLSFNALLFFKTVSPVNAAGISKQLDGITFDGTGGFYHANLNDVVKTGTYQNAPLYKLTGHPDWDTQQASGSFLLHFRMTGVNGKRIALEHTGSKYRLQRLWYKYPSGSWQVFPTADELITVSGNTVARVLTPVFNQNTVEISTFLPYFESDFVSLNNTYANNSYVTISSVGNSPQGRPLYRYIITDKSYTPTDGKKNVVVVSGQHAYEMLGVRSTAHFIEKLLSNDPKAVNLRKKAKILVYPFINTDGIAIGNQRNNSLYVDLNRAWLVNESDPQVVPKEKAVEVNLVRQDIVAQTGGRATAFMDIHNTEMYQTNFYYGAYETPRNPESQKFLQFVKNYFGTLTNSFGMTMYWNSSWANDTDTGITAGGWGKGKLNAPVSLTIELNQFNDGDYQGTLKNADALMKALDDYIPGTVIPTPTSSPPPLKPGDADNDGDVDGVDYTRWLNNYNTQKSGPSNGDFNNNGVVDGVDYTIWLNNYNS